jgi:hypothetical protein
MRAMISDEQIAHDLALAYVMNRHGAEVKGKLDINSYEGEVTGTGEVKTERLPGVDVARMVRVSTGEKRLFGLVDRKELVDSGERAVDAVFIQMIDDYRTAYARFLELLSSP